MMAAHGGSAARVLCLRPRLAGATGAAAGVSATGRLSAASLCSAEGKGKPKRQCVAGLAKLSSGSAANPRAACRALAKKKTKDVRGKSPHAVCVAAAAKLMASMKAATGNGAADSQGASTDDDPSLDDSSGDAPGAQPACVDANGNTVPADSPDVEECDQGSAGADDGSSGADDGSSSADSGSD